MRIVSDDNTHTGYQVHIERKTLRVIFFDLYVSPGFRAKKSGCLTCIGVDFSTSDSQSVDIVFRRFDLQILPACHNTS